MKQTFYYPIFMLTFFFISCRDSPTPPSIAIESNSEPQISKEEAHSLGLIWVDDIGEYITEDEYNQYQIEYEREATDYFPIRR